MKNDNQKKRILNSESVTALMAAIHRFIATKERGFVGPDQLARMFLPPKAKFFLSFAFFRKVFKNKLHKMVPGTYEYVTARTKFFDQLFVQAVTENVPQIVFLGAGYDTRALRFQDTIKETRIFELDVPTTQNNKLKLLKKNGIAIPANLSFAPVNFDTDDLGQALLNAGYDPHLMTLFMWEGVTMYITEEAVNETLSFIKNNSGAGSTVVFDYLYQSVILGQCDYYGARQLAESAKDKEEPFSFGIEEGQIKEFLLERGFSLLKHYTPQEFEKKYLVNKNGNFLGKMYGFACHTYAEAQDI